MIGTGHYARVQLAMSLKDGRKYAVKIIKKSEGKEAMMMQLQSECYCDWQWILGLKFKVLVYRVQGLELQAAVLLCAAG